MNPCWTYFKYNLLQAHAVYFHNAEVLVLAVHQDFIGIIAAMNHGSNRLQNVAVEISGGWLQYQLAAINFVDIEHSA